MDDILKQLTGVTPVILGLDETRCKKCNKLLGYMDGRYEIKCPRCGEMNVRKENVKDGEKNT